MKVNCLPENSPLTEIKDNAALNLMYTGFHSLSLSCKRKVDLFKFESQRSRYLKNKIQSQRILSVKCTIMHNFQVFVLNDNRIFMENT